MAGADVVSRLRDVTNAHDVDGIVGCFRADYRLDNPCHPARSFTGVEQVRRNWTGMFAAVPDLRVEVVTSVSAGASVWTQWEMRGTRTDGATHLLRGVIIFQVAGDQIASASFFVEPVDPT